MLLEEGGFIKSKVDPNVILRYYIDMFLTIIMDIIFLFLMVLHYKNLTNCMNNFEALFI